MSLLRIIVVMLSMISGGHIANASSFIAKATFSGYFADDFPIYPNYLCGNSGETICGTQSWAGKKFNYTTWFVASARVGIGSNNNIGLFSPISCEWAYCGNELYVDSQLYGAGLAWMNIRWDDIGNMDFWMMHDTEMTPTIFWVTDTPMDMFRLVRFNRPSSYDQADGILEVRNGIYNMGTLSWFGKPYGCRDVCSESFWKVRNLTLTISSGVPEPNTWTSMVLGFFAAGATVRSSRRIMCSKLH